MHVKRECIQWLENEHLRKKERTTWRKMLKAEETSEGRKVMHC
jgi:hypothetical protein